MVNQIRQVDMKNLYNNKAWNNAKAIYAKLTPIWHATSFARLTCTKPILHN